MGPLLCVCCKGEDVEAVGDAVDDAEKVGFGWTTPICPRRRAKSGLIMLDEDMSGSSPS